MIQAAADGFTKQTGIKVDIQWQGRDVLTKLTPTLRTGSPADLVDESVNSLGELVSLGQDTDLTPLYNTKVTGETQTIGQVIPAKYQQYLQDKNGKPFMVPYEVATEAVARSADSPPPWSVAAPGVRRGELRPRCAAYRACRPRVSRPERPGTGRARGHPRRPPGTPSSRTRADPDDARSGPSG